MHKVHFRGTVVENLPNFINLDNTPKSQTAAMTDFLELKQWVDYRYITYLQVNFKDSVQKKSAYQHLRHFLQRKTN